MINLKVNRSKVVIKNNYQNKTIYQKQQSQLNNFWHSSKFDKMRVS